MVCLEAIGVKNFRIASFRHDKETSVSYKNIGSVEELVKEVSRIIYKTRADYVSLRIIRLKKDE